MLDKAKALLATFKAQSADIWNRTKIYVIAIVGIILALEFNNIKNAISVYFGKKEAAKDKVEDTKLATKEDDDKAKADALVQAAKDLPGQQPPVGQDWYKK